MCECNNYERRDGKGIPAVYFNLNAQNINEQVLLKWVYEPRAQV